MHLIVNDLGSFFEKTNMIEHTVSFSLNHEPGSPEEQEFLDDAAKLASIPKVRDYIIRRQTSPKNAHAFGIFMKFYNTADFQEYCDHPMHVAFIEKRWLTEVSDFQEADFEAL